MVGLGARETTVRPRPARGPTWPAPPTTRTVSSGAAGRTGAPARPAVRSAPRRRPGPAPTRRPSTTRTVRGPRPSPPPARGAAATQSPPRERSSHQTTPATIRVLTADSESESALHYDRFKITGTRPSQSRLRTGVRLSWSLSISRLRIILLVLTTMLKVKAGDLNNVLLTLC